MESHARLFISSHRSIVYSRTQRAIILFTWPPVSIQSQPASAANEQSEDQSPTFAKCRNTSSPNRWLSQLWNSTDAPSICSEENRRCCCAAMPRMNKMSSASDLRFASCARSGIIPSVSCAICWFVQPVHLTRDRGAFALQHRFEVEQAYASASDHDRTSGVERCSKCTW